MNIFSRIQRLWQIAKTARQHGLDAELEPYLKFEIVKHLFNLLFGKPRYDPDKPYGVRLCEALQELGPIFIKFGQMMSMRPDVFPDHIVTELRPLQDQVEPFPSEQARAAIEKAIGQPISEIFSEFDDIPVASASVAQVHHAVLKSGEDVVVKVLRPDMEKQVQRDIGVMLTFARLFRLFWPKAKNYNPVEVVLSYAETLTNSLDLMIEAASSNRFRVQHLNDEFVNVPRVNWNFSRSEVMVMERVEGIPIREVEALREAGVDLNKLSERLINMFFVQVFEDGFFHGDLHPGNMFVSESGVLNIVDFGITGSLSDLDRSYLVDNITAILNRDYKGVVNAHIRSGWAPHDISAERFEVAIRTVCEPFNDQPVGELSFGALMGRLFLMTREFDIVIQPQLLLFQKTYMSLEGLTRMLNPELNIPDTVRPILDSWVRDKYTLRGFSENLRSELPHWIASGTEIPRLVHQVLSNMHHQQVREQSIRRSDPQQGLEKFYRGLFFAFAGVASLMAMIIDWRLSGFGPITILLLIVGAICLGRAWPKSGT